MPHPPGPVTSLSPATTVGPLLCRRRTTFASHRWATQKPPRRLCPNLPSLSSLCQETGDDPRSWPMKFGCLEWSSKGYRKSDGLWVSGSRRPPLHLSSVCWFRRFPLGFLVSVRRGGFWSLPIKGLGSPEFSVAAGQLRWRFPVADELSGRRSLAGIHPVHLFHLVFSYSVLWRCCGLQPAAGKCCSAATLVFSPPRAVHFKAGRAVFLLLYGSVSSGYAALPVI